MSTVVSLLAYLFLAVVSIQVDRLLEIFYSHSCSAGQRLPGKLLVSSIGIFVWS